MKEHADNSGNHADYDLLKFAFTRSNGSSFLLITQYEMPFINKSEVTKRSKDWKIYGKCTNGTNHRSHVWPVCFIYIIGRFQTRSVIWKFSDVRESNLSWSWTLSFDIVWFQKTSIPPTEGFFQFDSPTPSRFLISEGFTLLPPPPGISMIFPLGPPYP